MKLFVCVCMCQICAARLENPTDEPGTASGTKPLVWQCRNHLETDLNLVGMW